MRITADTNILVRALTGDDPRQAKLAQAALSKADAIALTLPVLCELVWVLSRGYRISSADIAVAMRRLLNAANVIVDRPATEAGLAVPEAGATSRTGRSRAKDAGLAPTCSSPSTARR